MYDTQILLTYKEAVARVPFVDCGKWQVHRVDNMVKLSLSLQSAAAIAVAVKTDAFSALPHVTPVSSTTSLELERPIGGRHFQLEELEDAETSTTDVLLNMDMTVTLGGTNGPLYTSSYGTWSDDAVGSEIEGEFKRLFEMRISRTFNAGAEGRDESDIGEFEYCVERTYRGECFLVGGSVFAMNGEILDVDELFGERKLGFFNMIDTTEERENNAMD